MDQTFTKLESEQWHLAGSSMVRPLVVGTTATSQTHSGVLASLIIWKNMDMVLKWPANHPKVALESLLAILRMHTCFPSRPQSAEVSMLPSSKNRPSEDNYQMVSHFHTWNHSSSPPLRNWTFVLSSSLHLAWAKWSAKMTTMSKAHISLVLPFRNLLQAWVSRLFRHNSNRVPSKGSWQAVSWTTWDIHRKMEMPFLVCNARSQFISVMWLLPFLTSTLIWFGIQIASFVVSAGWVSHSSVFVQYSTFILGVTSTKWSLKNLLNSSFIQPSMSWTILITVTPSTTMWDYHPNIILNFLNWYFTWINLDLYSRKDWKISYTVTAEVAFTVHGIMGIMQKRFHDAKGVTSSFLLSSSPMRRASTGI